MIQCKCRIKKSDSPQAVPDATSANASVSKMEEDEIDSWYEEEKQKLMDDYLKDLEDKKDHDVSQKKYEDKLNKLIEKYNKTMEEKIRQKNFFRKK